MDHDKASEFESSTKDHVEHGVVSVTSAFAGWTRAACIKKFWRLYITGLLVSLGGMYAGYANSVIGSLVANEGFIKQFATVSDPQTGHPALDATHVSVWNAISFASQILVQFVAPVTADRWGRKFNMWGLTFFLTLSIVLEIVAKEWIVLMLSRLAAGCASGMISTSVMVYMSEMAMPQFRGALLSSFALSFSLGQVFLAIGLKVLEDTEPLKFRNIFYSEFLFFAIWLVPMVYLPESPAWNSAKGKHELAKTSLRRLVGDVEGYDLDHEYKVMQQEIEGSISLAKSHADNAWRALLTPVNMKRIVIATLPFTFQNFVGVPLIFGYTTYFFSLADVEDPFLGNMIIQLILVVGIITGFYFEDRVGRRTLVLGGGFIMSILCCIIGGMGFMKQTAASGPVLVTLCSLWAFVYANSLAPIGWTSLVEVSSPLLRAKTTAIAAVIQALSGLVFNYTVPLMLSNQHAGWGQKIGLFFGGISLVYLIPCALLFPETKGRTYQELDELFERRIPAWKFAKTKTAYGVSASTA
ncbi:MFS hexose transporter [Colletotrichum karsti]|uniref:MFS hexose transporter n=1 Tax=Colletotrichum karsti TaxID=1095194 RepID=A0A9P6I3G3_9PEZI|nr:MFS hexose transporter [Colletotrichum karsti]KAF9874256.1 MFS hexose transporter [Colletotrichum karsti]